MSAEMVNLTIDGTQVSVPKGTYIIRAAEALGVEIPRFCEHPLLEPVGACRQCIVEVEGQRKLLTSCTTPVSEGMVVRTQHASAAAAKAQTGQLEFLLINHPLDCPVCDRGGECPLQDQALAYGPGESRYVDPKRVYQKPIALSPLVLLDRERCVLCTRCTRFCDQISGERFIEMFERGPAQQVSIAPGHDFASPFSGNTVQICPVGALLSSTYRFAARPFDLRFQDTVCTHCASGCTMRVDVRRGEVVRHLARDNDDVNEAWLCDKGRYAFRYPDLARLETPMLRAPGLTPVSFEEALRAVADRASGGRIAFLTGGRLMDEDAFALSKLARTVFGTNDLDHRQLPSSAVVPISADVVPAAGMPVTYDDVEHAPVIVLLGLDSREELPILHLRIRKAVRNHGARVLVVHPRRTALADVGEHVLCRPGQEAAILEAMAGSLGDGGPYAGWAAAIREAGERGVILAGQRLAESDGALDMAITLALQTGAKFTYLPRRAGDRGALKAGVHPRLLPGGRRIEEPGRRAEVEALWGSLPDRPGLDARAILEAAANREIDVLYLVGVDPMTDFPDADLARRAIQNAPFRVVQDLAADAYERYADVMLPAAAYPERDGHLTDWEGRSQRLRGVRPPRGMARPDWQIFQELSQVAGRDMGFHSIEALRAEMGRLLEPRDAELTSSGARAPESPPADELTLYTYPLLVDEGTLLRGADELKAALQQDAFVELNVADAERLGLADGDRAVVRTDRGEAELPVRVGDAVAEGVAFVPWNQPGLRANALLSGRLTAPVTVSPLGATAREPAAEGVS